VRPVIWAHAENVQFPNTIAALNLQWQAETPTHPTLVFFRAVPQSSSCLP